MPKRSRRTRLHCAVLCGMITAGTAPLHAGDGVDDGWRVPQKIVPLTTAVKLDAFPLTIATKNLWSLGLADGTSRGPTVDLSAITALRAKVEERLNGTRYERRQTGWYLSGRSMDRQKVVTTVQHDAVDVYGFHLQLTLTGSCVEPGADPGELCTFTPGLSIPTDAYDPMWVPTRFDVSSGVGDRISAETAAALAEDGFSRGLPGQPAVGLDLLIRNSGFEANEARSAATNRIERTERVQQTVVPSVIRLDQSLHATANEAELTHTIRGAVLLPAEDWTAEAAITQLLGWVLPGRKPRIVSTAGMPNPDVNNNLFFAATNVRTPANGLTVYQAGSAYVRHPEAKVTDPLKQPPAWYNGVWVGFTPASGHRMTETRWLTAAGAPTVIGSGQGDGGNLGTVSQEAIDLTGSIQVIGDNGGLIPLENLANSYVQAGVTATQQDAVLSHLRTRTTNTRLIPHLSFTGNRTAPRSVVRYYAGTMIADVEKPTVYVGADARFFLERKTNLALGVIGYHEPDNDYYSNASVALDRTFTLGNSQQVTLRASYSHSFDRPAVDIGLDENRRFEADAQYKRNDVVFSLGTAFVQSADGAWNNSVTLGTSRQVSDRLAVAAAVTPISDLASYTAADLRLNWRTAEETDASVLSVGSRVSRYDFGPDQFGNERKQDDWTIEMTLRKGF